MASVMCIECEVARAELSRKRDNTPPEPPTKKTEFVPGALWFPFFASKRKQKASLRK